MNEEARAIIIGLIQLANSATYSCDLAGAEKIAQLKQAAEQTVAKLTELIDAPAVIARTDLEETSGE